jgi:hypothetical protein
MTVLIVLASVCVVVGVLLRAFSKPEANLSIEQKK